MKAVSASDRASEFDAADRCVQRGEFTAALRIFEDLLTKPVPAQARRVIWVNIAIVNDEMLRVDDALRAYDEAIIVERSIQGYWASWEKAAYLAKIRSDLPEEDRRKIAENVETLRQTPRSR